MEDELFEFSKPVFSNISAITKNAKSKMIEFSFRIQLTLESYL